MKLTRIIIITFIVTSTTLFADDGLSDCERFTKAIADEYYLDAKKATQAFQNKLNKIRDTFFQLNNVPHQAAFDKLLKALFKKHRLEEIHADRVEKFIKRIRAIPQTKRLEGLCNNQAGVKRGARNAFKKYKAVIDQVLEAATNEGKLFQLDKNEGFAIIALVFDGYADQVELERVGSFGREMFFGPLNHEKLYRLIKLKKGTYYWGKLKTKLTWNNTGYSYHDLTDKKFQFKIEPGKINYTGVLVYESSGGYGDAYLQDRLTMIMTVLEQKYPHFMDVYPMVNNLFPYDPFLNFYLDEKTKKITKAKQ